MRIAGSGRSTRNSDAPSAAFAITMPTEAPCAPVMNALRPSITQWFPSRRAVVCIIEGSEPAPPSPAGSVMKKAERASPRSSGSRKRAFCGGVATSPEQVHVALVRCGDVHRDWTERRQARGSQHQGHFAVMEVGAVGKHVRREHAGLARLAAQFGDQGVAWPMRTAPRIALVAGYRLAHELLDARGDRLGASHASINGHRLSALF